jgi:phosphoribosylanthranilate isomerase
MTKIKVCGLRRPEDVAYVNKLKPDYVGFVFAESKRRVTAAAAAKLASGLDPAIKKVGIFVDEDPEVVRSIAEQVPLDILQFHGHESPAYLESFGDKEIWKALPIATKEDIGQMARYPQNTLLLDAKVSGAAGGSGVPFDWDLLSGADLDRGRIVLAGGLNPDNVAQAIEKVRPFAVDVSSGVETDGFKDYQKMKTFIEKVRLAPH